MSPKKAFELADIHNHLVPGVDDGARSPAEALRHLQLLRADGVTRLAVSPHLDGRLASDGDALPERFSLLRSCFEELRRKCAARTDVPQLLFSQEILTPDPDTAAAVFRYPGVGVGDTGYALIEFGFRPLEDPVDVIRTVVRAGRHPIVAHPERYHRGTGTVISLDEIRGWKEAGALLQVNAGSILGDHGPLIEELAWQVLGDGLADLLATDHHADSRPIAPSEAVKRLQERGAGEQARLLFGENPARIIEGLPTREVRPVRSHAVA